LGENMANDAYPWNEWIPGVLSNKQLKELCKKGFISDVSDDSKNEPSIDLTISTTAYEMTSGSLKPKKGRYIELCQENSLAKKIKVPDNGIFILKRRNTYLFKLKERLKELNRSPIYGEATAKSTIGRIDVLARLIVDGMDRYEGFDPQKIDSGDMFVEITPMTFDVGVKEGTALNQLRLFVGKPEDSIITSKYLTKTILKSDKEDDDFYLTVDLTPINIGDEKASTFCATDKQKRLDPINLWEKEKYDPCEYWKVFPTDKNGFLQIKKNDFYILRSKELLSVPKGIAIYCRAIDETIGEMRIHYAGFVHPYFGTKRTDRQVGTPLIFEVRGHHINVCLRDGEKLAKLIFYRMSEDCDEVGKSYDDQSLTLSKIFKKWPDKIKVSEDGAVEPLNN